jgi:hypothetical protein
MQSITAASVMTIGVIEAPETGGTRTRGGCKRTRIQRSRLLSTC